MPAAHAVPRAAVGCPPMSVGVAVIIAVILVAITFALSSAAFASH